MSYTNLTKAIKMASEFEDYFSTGGQSLDVMRKAEKLLGVTFSKQISHYIREYGYISFSGNEIYGISSDSFEDLNILEGNIVETVLVDRKKYNLPNEWLPIYFFDDGYYGYLDYSQHNEDGEPPVIMVIYDGEKYVVVEKIAEDLGDFLLGLVEEQMSNQ